MMVKGRCVACGERSLFVGEGGWLTCSWSECTAPDATGRLLEGPLLRPICQLIEKALAEGLTSETRRT